MTKCKRHWQPPDNFIKTKSAHLFSEAGSFLMKPKKICPKTTKNKLNGWHGNGMLILVSAQALTRRTNQAHERHNTNNSNNLKSSSPPSSIQSNNNTMNQIAYLNRNERKVNQRIKEKEYLERWWLEKKE